MADTQLRLNAVVTDSFSGPLSKLKTQLATVGNVPSLKNVGKDLSAVRGHISTVSSDLRTSLTPALLGVNMAGLTAGGALAGLGLAIKSFSGNTRQLSLFSKEVGMSADELRKLRALGERFGVPFEQTQQSLKVFAGNLDLIKKSWGDAYGQLRSMNLADVANDLKAAPNMKAAIDTALNAIKQIQNPVRRRQVAELLFGSDQWAVLAVEGTAAVKAEIAKALGNLPAGSENAAEIFERNFARMREAIEGFRDQAIGPLLPQVNALFERLEKPIGGELTKFFDGLTLVFNKLEAATKAWNEGGFFSALKALDQIPALGPGTPGVKWDKEIAQREASIRLKKGTLSQIEPFGSNFDKQREELNQEIKQLTDEIRKLREGEGAGGKAEKSSFWGPGGGAQSLIQQASLGGGGGGFGRAPRIFGSGGGGPAGPGVPQIGQNLLASPGTPSFGAGTAFKGTGDHTLDAIIRAEGTAKKGDPFEETLGYGQYGKPSKPLTQMTLREAYAFGRQIRSRHGSSSAIGAFQIVGQTMKDVGMPGAGLGWDDKFDKQNQMAMARAILKKQGLGAWEGFKGNPRELAIAQRGGRYDMPAEATAGAPAGSSGGRIGDEMMGRSRAMNSAPVPARVEGGATIDINFNGLPPGAKVKHGTSGDLFREVNVRRTRQMPALA